MELITWIVALVFTYLVYRMTIRKAVGDFPPYEDIFGEVAVTSGTFCVLFEDGETSTEYCCEGADHRSLEEANECWRKWEHFTNYNPALCNRCGSNIDVAPDMPCLQCAVNRMR